MTGVCMRMEPVRAAAEDDEEEEADAAATADGGCDCAGTAATATDALVVLTAPFPSATLLMTSTLAAMTRRSIDRHRLG